MAQGRRHASGRVRGGGGELTQQLLSRQIATLSQRKELGFVGKARLCCRISGMWLAPLSLTIMPGGEGDAPACTRAGSFGRSYLPVSVIIPIHYCH